MNAVKIISTEIDELRRRLVKFLRFGRNDVQTAIEAAPYGFDSHPVKDMIALYAPTTQNGKSVIVGYLNKNQLAEIGELRLFSTNAQGDEQAYIWLKNDGVIELGGDEDFLVRYSKLEEAFNTLKADLNALTNSYNSHTHVTSATIGSSATPGKVEPTASKASESNANISPAKIESIKTR